MRKPFVFIRLMGVTTGKHLSLVRRGFRGSCTSFALRGCTVLLLLLVKNSTYFFEKQFLLVYPLCT